MAKMTITLSGRIGQIEEKTTKNGEKNFFTGTICSSDVFKKGDDWVEKPNWFSWKAFGEDEVKYLKNAKTEKGDFILFTAEIDISAGEKKYYSLNIEKIISIVKKDDAKKLKPVNHIVIAGKKATEWEVKEGFLGNSIVIPYTRKVDGKYEYQSEWIGFTANGKTAEKLAEIPRKNEIYVEGSIFEHSYEKDGKKISSIRIHVTKVLGDINKVEAKDTAKTNKDEVTENTDASSDVPDFMSVFDTKLEDIPFN